MHETDWDKVLRAWLHDPFDKALAVRGHEPRATRYASAALGREVYRRGLHRLTAGSDVVAAVAERVPSPTAGRDGERAVGPADGLRLVHPASGAPAELNQHDLDPDKAVAVVEEIVGGLPGPRERYLAIWRLLPDAVAGAFGEDAARLPADTRIPDHTVFQHTDITAGLYAAGAPDDNAAFLSFALGPVQSFIAAARSVRDLWSGSALLSWLAFQAMKPILERLGPTAFVFPALRGAALMDLWLRGNASLGDDRIPMPSPWARMAPSLPHRFVAVVPWGEDGAAAQGLRRECLDAAQDGWRRLADAVRARIGPQFASLSRDWARLWEAQIESALEFRAVVAPERELRDDGLARLVGESSFSSAWPEARKVRKLGEAIPCEHRQNYEQDSAGRWQAQMEICARLSAAGRAVRHVPAAARIGADTAPAKCTLFGSWEQMGPAEFRASRDFWEKAEEQVEVDAVRIRPRERLCAVALTKRFAGPALLASELGVKAEDLRFPDTPTVAAREWLVRAGIDPEAERRRSGRYWSGLWLHWRRRDEKDKDEGRKPDEDLWCRIHEARKPCRHGPAPVYYAVLAMDGDEMGRWLAGAKTPELRKLLHPKLCGYFEGLDDARVNDGLRARRPVGPALHAAISAALSTFASEVAPQVVREHHGTLIYSGGDNLLALCPVVTALACAHALRDAFSGRDDPAGDGWRRCGPRRRITMGERASMSAGLAVVHYHDDLRIALETARVAEGGAKRAGRDCLGLVTARRSGETASAICPWSCVPWFDALRRKFAEGASDRWIYRLRAELPALTSGLLPFPAMRSEICRLVARSHGEGDGGTLRGDEVADAFGRYRGARRNGAAGEALRDFVTIAQSAAFMGRGQDG